MFEGGVDMVAAEMAMEESTDLFSGQSVGGGVEGLTDTVGSGVTGAGAEEEGGTRRAVLPYFEGGVEMGRLDDGTAVESCVDGAEAQNLGFGAAGGCAVEARTGLAQGGVAIVPKLSRGFIAAKKDLRCAVSPFESATQFAGDRG
jgi:hypothetical protein